MIKTYCDVCGQEINELKAMRKSFFDYYVLCPDCMKKVEDKNEDWKDAKLALLKRFVASQKPAKKQAKKPAKPCACKGGETCARKPAKIKQFDPALIKPVAVKTTCNGKCHKHEAMITTAELAAEIGKKANIVQCYAYRNGLGITDKKRRVRLYNQEDADRIRKHFEK